MQLTASNSSLETQRPIPEVNIFPDGFLAIRRGIFSHLQDGRMTPVMYAIYSVILDQFDWSSGVWLGSTHRLFDSLGQKTDRSTIKDNLARLYKLGYLKSLRKSGRRGNYYVLINAWRPTVGNLKGYELNTDRSTSLDDLFFEFLPDSRLNVTCRFRDGRLTVSRRSPDGRPYQDNQDTQDAQDCKNSREVAGVVEQSFPSCDPESKPTGNDESILLEVRQLYEEHSCESYNDTAQQKQKILSYARQYGPDAFLNAFELWARWDASDQCKTKDGTLTFPLVKFLDPPAVENYIQKARGKDARFVKRTQKYGQEIKC
jgi:hypothetical protein